MSNQVSHGDFQIIAYPASAITAQIMYLQVGQEIPAAAVCVAGGWRIVHYGDNIVSRSVGDQVDAYKWLTALGELTAATQVHA